MTCELSHKPPHELFNIKDSKIIFYYNHYDYHLLWCSWRPQLSNSYNLWGCPWSIWRGTYILVHYHTYVGRALPDVQSLCHTSTYSPSKPSSVLLLDLFQPCWILIHSLTGQQIRMLSSQGRSLMQKLWKMAGATRKLLVCQLFPSEAIELRTMMAYLHSIWWPPTEKQILLAL